MKSILIVLLPILSCACDKEFISHPVQTVPSDSSFSDRTYIIDVPQNWIAKKSYPLVIVLHGASGSGAGMRTIAGFYNSVYRDSLIFLYPDAKVENWEEGCRCNKPYRLGIDDVGFINYLMDEVTNDYPVDTARIYAIGFSQGGLFAHNLGCKLGHRLAAIGSVASAMSVPLSEDCAEPSTGISVLIIHGQLDAVLPYSGTQDGSFSLLSAPATAVHWAKKLSLTQTVAQLEVNEHVKLDIYRPENASQLCLYSIVDGGHAWNFTGLSTKKTVLDFFLSHKK